MVRMMYGERSCDGTPKITPYRCNIPLEACEGEVKLVQDSKVFVLFVVKYSNVH